MEVDELLAARRSLKRVSKKDDGNASHALDNGLSARQQKLCASNEYTKRPDSFSFMGHTMIIENEGRISGKLSFIMQELAVREAEHMEEEEKQMQLKMLKRKQREIDENKSEIQNKNHDAILNPSITHTETSPNQQTTNVIPPDLVQYSIEEQEKEMSLQNMDNKQKEINHEQRMEIELTPMKDNKYDGASSESTSYERPQEPKMNVFAHDLADHSTEEETIEQGTVKDLSMAEMISMVDKLDHEKADTEEEQKYDSPRPIDQRTHENVEDINEISDDNKVLNRAEINRLKWDKFRILSSKQNLTVLHFDF